MLTRSSPRRLARFTPCLRTAVATLSIAALLGACAMPKHPDTSAPPPDPFNPAAAQLLDNTSWTLSAWKQADGTARAIPSQDQGPLTLTLSTEGGKRHASGFSGCNRFMGPYMLKDGKLSLGPLAGTRMACASPGGEIERPFLDALAHIDRTGVQMRPPQQMQLILDDGATLVFDRSDGK
ncbi:META domain-containing protein [Paraburkholderia sp. Ac-20336]|uniref:META domain-containing protein n=1 Tax=unclassified Paraburkholderia TaxID=2615204 RepID=UPI0019803EA3|nr:MULTISPECIES: META domain-containing protein [unclassified Paraburkholderia]MBN3803674.1 META domain-containing protein [Paraburkholderia sp. Ac-20336]MBN3846191.1 META domain-containing protein [Paraburkholderia sp. Ac-20342]